MTRDISVLIAHPGKHHALHLVAGCIKSGVSVVYITPFYRCGLGALIARLPGKIGKQASGYFNLDIPIDHVVSPTSWQIRKLFALSKNDDLFYRDFDLFVAQAINTRKYQSKVLVTLQDYMPKTVAAAKSRGWKIWSDQILNQSNGMRIRISKHENYLGMTSPWEHSESSNDEIIAGADIITVPSGYTLDGISHRASKNTKIFTIPYGASAQQFSGSALEDIDVITILARAHSVRKGGHLLLKALHQCGGDLLAACGSKKIRVRILGEYEPVLTKLLSQVNLPKGLTVEHGNVPHTEVAVLYRRASLFVMPSLSESMSLACIEAMHAGLPLIITEYCGIDGFRHGEMGYEVEDTLESIANNLIKAFENQDLWPQWSAAVRKLAHELTWDRYTSSISKICREITI